MELSQLKTQLITNYNKPLKWPRQAARIVAGFVAMCGEP